MKENNSLAALVNPGEAENYFDIAGLAEFDPGATAGYHRTNALWLAEFSRLIYRQECDEVQTRPAGFRTRDDFLRPHGWREAEGDFINVGGTQAAFFTHAKLACAVLVFRGTLGLTDLITDTRFILGGWLPQAGQIHIGFRDELQKVWGRLATRLAEFPYPVFLTGHSLGAALATLTAARILIEGKLPPPAALYTFGSPRVGTAQFTQTLSGVYHCRVVNDQDVVATLPPPPLYQHDGELHHLRHDGTVEVRPRGPAVRPVAPPSRSLKRTAAALKGFVGGLKAFDFGLPESLTDHTPVNYTARLEAAGDSA